MILSYAQCFTEPLKVNDLSLTEETDRVTDLRILHKAEDIVVSGAGFLFGGHILVQVCDRIAFALELTGVEGDSACGLGPDTGRMIHIVGGEALFLQLFGA